MNTKNFCQDIEHLSQKKDLTVSERRHLIHIGLELFRQGRYWDAHEAWEVLWKTKNRNTSEALILQGCIQAAAALLKHRQGNARGFHNLSKRALDKLHPPTDLQVHGLSLSEVLVKLKSVG